MALFRLHTQGPDGQAGGLHYDTSDSFLGTAAVRITAALIVLVPLLSGCATQSATAFDPVTVAVPVAVRPEPPPELLAQLRADRPVFVPPTDPAATSALTEEGERRLKALVGELLRRINAWEAWAR